MREFVSPQATVCAVVKCDAYGHGAVECARALQDEGASWFGVTSTEEAVRLRRGGISGRILVMTGFWRGEELEVLEHDLTPTVWSSEHVELLESAARRMRRPKREVPVHLKVDTGMTRLGVSSAELPELCGDLLRADHLTVEGVFSHLASSETLDAEDAKKQIARFNEVRGMVREAGITPAYEHLANSAAIAGRPDTLHNMVRPGLLLYGSCLPLENGSRHAPKLDVTPVLSWKTRIIALRDIPAGRAIGYGGNFVTQRPTRMAVIPVGYGDGFTRQLSSRGRVIINDRYAPIIGNVSMDLTTVDVTDIAGASLGDEVILIGSSENCKITMEEHAAMAQTIPYEIICGLSPRVPRHYVE